MASAYATFPRDGVYSAPYLYTVVTDSDGKVILSNGDYDVSVADDNSVTISWRPPALPFSVSAPPST